MASDSDDGFDSLRGRIRVPIPDKGPVPPGRIVRVAQASREDRELTLYVKGFLTRGERPDHFGAWHHSHQALEGRFGWGPRVYGYCWPSGRIDSVPLPKLAPAHALVRALRPTKGASAAKTSMRFRAAGFVGLAMAEEVAQIAVAFGQQYGQASRLARERADEFAERLLRLRRRYETLRIVAHSLGCLHVIEAVSRLAPDLRPDEIHLCAPACSEEEVAAHLPNLSRSQTFLYHARSDLVLRAGFPVVSRAAALGAAGPRGSYEGMSVLEVSEHFRFLVHLRYKNLFANFACDRRHPNPKEH